MGEYLVVVGAGTLRRDGPQVVRFPHRWTPGGVSVEATFTGAHLLHLAAAGCVLNDVFREAEPLGLLIAGVRVTASGGIDPAGSRSSGIEYVVELDSPASAAELDALLDQVDAVAEIPKWIRAGASVQRIRS